MEMNLFIHDPIPAVYDLFFPNPNTQTTGSSDLTPEMRTYYSDYMVDLAEPELVHDQFGQKHPIPKNGGKTINFHRYDPLPEMLTPLVEGVTPDGQSLRVTDMESTVSQYGAYITYSDMLLLTAVDNNLVRGTELQGSQAGRTSDTITREVLAAGTNVQYAAGQVSSRQQLVGGDATAANNHYLTVDAIAKAVRTLENQDCPKIDGYYVGIIHPNAKYDLMRDPDWRKPHEYQDTVNLYKNEIGELHGVRFVQNTRAKIFHAEDLASDSRTLALSAAASATTSLSFDGGTVAEGALVGRYLLIGTQKVKVTANTTSAITVDTAVTAADDTVIYPGEGGKNGRDVYATLILGKDAFGVTEITGGGLEFIVKQLGSGDDPLNQRATSGWKLTKTAEILIQQYMIRIEHTVSA